MPGNAAEIRLPAEQSQIADRLSDNLQTQIDVKGQIADEGAGISGMSETKWRRAPARSLKPVGVSPGFIVVLGAILGLVFGVLAAFSMEFGKAVSAHMEG